jgi:hypothetical protein
MAALKLILGLLAIIWLAMAAFMYATQGSLLYQPRPLTAFEETQLMNDLPGVEPYLVNTPDGQALAGWHLPRKRGRGLAPALVYFGGNAEDALDFMKQAASFPGVSLFAVNYRGYGRSTGAPSEKALKEDALAVHDQAAAATGGLALVMGRSLGAGLAAHVAAYRELAGAILVTPFDSILNVAKGHYPFLPVKQLLKEHYDAVPDAKRAETPAVFFTANQDNIIPPARGQALYDAWKGTDKRIVAVPLAGHNDIQQFSAYKNELALFLKERVN